MYIVHFRIINVCLESRLIINIVNTVPYWNVAAFYYGKLSSHTYFILVASNDRMNDKSNFIMKLWCFSVSLKVVEDWIDLVAYSQATFIHSQIFVAVWTSMFNIFQAIDATRNTGTTPSPKMKVMVICAYYLISYYYQM